mmetsp:Transcript_263/g.587  ORF Transcript_263/g.587 Transcript_263/m.587 type:complete len:243 (-) Transcript_263:60-788(-)
MLMNLVLVSAVLRIPQPLSYVPPLSRSAVRANAGDMHQQLADMVGEGNADRLMQVNSVSRLADGSLLTSISKLRKEFGISGNGLVAFMSITSVVARLDDETFWAGLVQLSELGISGDGLATFMGGSVAARLDDQEFMNGLSQLCSELSPPVVVELLKNNNPLASRLTVPYAQSVLNITRHLDSQGLDGAKSLKALIGKTPLVGKVPALEAILLSANTRDSIDEALKRFRGTYAHKRAIAATL